MAAALSFPILPSGEGRAGAGVEQFGIFLDSITEDETNKGCKYPIKGWSNSNTAEAGKIFEDGGM